MQPSVMATFVIVFREVLEGSLIVGIILTVLWRLRSMRYAPLVWASSLFAVGMSVAIGFGLSALTQAAQGWWEKMIEGMISLMACLVLTYMVFWMDRQSRRIKPEIEHKVETAISQRELSAIILLPFLAVLREGSETVLFLQAIAMQDSAMVSLTGCVLGALLAVGLASLLFIGGRKVPLKTLFRSTGVFLLFIAAGLLAYGIHELQELGWLPVGIAHVWDINHLLNERQGLGAFLKALFGYNGNPSLIEVVAYVTYLAWMIYVLRSWFKSSTRIPPHAPVSSTQTFPSGASPAPPVSEPLSEEARK